MMHLFYIIRKKKFVLQWKNQYLNNLSINVLYFYHTSAEEKTADNL